MLIKLAWRNLWRNRRRTLITAAAVFFAVLISSVMTALQNGMYEKMIENVVGFYTGYVQVHQKGYWNEQTLDNSLAVSEESLRAIQAARHVQGAAPRLESFALAAAGDKSAPVSVIGTDPEAEQQLTGLRDKLVAGEYLRDGEPGILVASGLAEKLGLGLGDSLILLSQGFQGSSAVGQYPIKGLLRFGSPELNKVLVYLPLAEAQRFYGAEERLSSYALLLDQGSKAPQVVKALRQSLDTAQYEVMDWQEMMPGMVQMMQADVGGNYITLGILYLVIAFGIFGTVLMMTQERKYEFGVMVALGMKRLRLAAVVVLELFFISLLGVAAGMLGAIPLAWYFKLNPIYLGSEMEGVYASYGFEPVMPASTEPVYFLGNALTVFLITSLIALYPVWKISRLDALRSMRG
jgi:ABC-type lipoprotein release transport system permease subunit